MCCSFYQDSFGCLMVHRGAGTYVDIGTCPHLFWDKALKMCYVCIQNFENVFYLNVVPTSAILLVEFPKLTPKIINCPVKLVYMPILDQKFDRVKECGQV